MHRVNSACGFTFLHKAWHLQCQPAGSMLVQWYGLSASYLQRNTGVICYPVIVPLVLPSMQQASSTFWSQGGNKQKCLLEVLPSSCCMCRLQYINRCKLKAAAAVVLVVLKGLWVKLVGAPGKKGGAERGPPTAYRSTSLAPFYLQSCIHDDHFHWYRARQRRLAEERAEWERQELQAQQAAQAAAAAKR